MNRGEYDLEDKSNKIYCKVLKYYNRGMLEKALEVCDDNEEAVQANSALLNLRGLMHYLKGEMNEARRCWNLNYKIYADVVSEKYLLDSKNDEELWKCYVKGVKLARALNVTGAIMEFERCKMKSNFNAINVNNQLTRCYMQKSNYDEAIKCINYVLSVDKYNKEAHDNRKLLKELNIIRNPKRNIVVAALAGVVIFVSVLSAGIRITAWKNKAETKGKVKDQLNDMTKDMTNDEIKKDEKKETEKDTKNGTEKEPIKQIEDAPQVKFPLEKLHSYLENKDYKSIDVELDKWEDKKSSLGINEKTILNKCRIFMDNNAGEYFYKLAYDLSKSGNYKDSIDYYKRSLKYGRGQFPYEHALYMLGVAYNKNNDYENSIIIFEKYYEEYKNKTYVKEGNYIEDVLRYLRTMTQGVDEEKYNKYKAK